MGSAVFDKERFLEVLLTTTMSEVKLVIERDDETRKGMNGPRYPSPSPRKRSSSSQTGFLPLLRLGAGFIQQLEQLRSCIFIQGMRELGNGGWDPGAERPFAFGGRRIRAIWRNG